MTCSIKYAGQLTCAHGVKDRQATSQWYIETLGFELLYDSPEANWCELKSPVTNVFVGFSDVESPDTKGGATLVFEVTDIDSARSELEGKNVPFDGETLVIPDLVKLATFYDPDGHKLMLSESLQSGGE